ncbi:MAG: hypothetical protein RR490_01610 [Niameybacter sp.]
MVPKCTITAYELACGYIQKETFRTKTKQIDVQIFKEGAFKVKIVVWDIVEPFKGICGIETDITNPDITWKVFDTLVEAKKEYNKYVVAAHRLEVDSALFEL